MLLQNADLKSFQKDIARKPSSLDHDGTSKEEENEEQESSHALHILDCAPSPGWTAHVFKEGRLYYCNHINRTAGWLPPIEAWKTKENALPYGWERAIDESGKSYYINHINKTTTYETPIYQSSQPLPVPKPRIVTLERSSTLGFGFVAGSEKPVVVRFVTEGGPSVDKLLPGDQILSVNGEDVKTAPREHVISLVRSCVKSVTLQVCQPAEQQGVRKSTLLSAQKRARLKCKPSRVRFAESVCVNGAPLFPQSAFTLGDLGVPPMANVLKVFLENGQTKSFKYDTWTTVKDVINSLETKLCLKATEHFSLVVEHVKSLKRNKLTLLDPNDSIVSIASQPGAHKLRCLFRITFVPTTAAELAQRDLNALDYLFNQCCNDVIQERFSPELQCDTALRLAALHICHHALANNIPANKLSIKTIERQFGLERFIPGSILENIKRKEIRKVLGHFLKLHLGIAGPGKQLTALQIKLHYLDIASQLPSYGARCFSTGPMGDGMENVILVSPKFGIGQITGRKNSVFQPVPLANLEDMKRIEVKIQDEIYRLVFVILQNNKVLQICLEERDALELILVFQGYFKLITQQDLPIDQEKLPNVDMAPPYLAEHRVIPEKWSYIEQNGIKIVSFGSQPIYKSINKKTNGLYNTMGRHSKPTLLIDYSFDSNMNSFISSGKYPYVHMNSLDEEAVNTSNKNILRHIQSNSQSDQDPEEQQNLLQKLSEWQETSVDVESDSDEPGKLKHSDSLTLLNKIHKQEENTIILHDRIQLRRDSSQIESDSDSVYTPPNSPYNKRKENELSLRSRVSFGLRSPSTSAKTHQNLQEFLLQVYGMENSNKTNTLNTVNNMFVFDSDIIDLTMIPPPRTPDKLDSALPTPINVPPMLFADCAEKLSSIDLNENQDLEEFLESVTVPPPTQKVTPAMELTPEEILAYIIPPPPSKLSMENLVANDEQNDSLESEEKNVVFHKMNSQISVENKTSLNPVLPVPKRNMNQKPPDRPPKDFRKTSLHTTEDLKPNPTEDLLPVPVLPPRNNSNPPVPQRLSLPPKKLDIKLSPEVKYGINSHIDDNIFKKIDREGNSSFLHQQRSFKKSSTAVSTPISVYANKTVGEGQEEKK